MTYLSDDLYKTVTDSMPIVCVDFIPIRKSNTGWQIGVIKRATEPEAGQLTLIGGRIQHGETISGAISRHLSTDLGIQEFQFALSNSEPHPFYVQQYQHQENAKSPFGFDPTKHSIGLTYLIKIDREPAPANEASSFHWLSKSDVPAKAGYNQHFLMQKAFVTLESEK